MVQFTHCRAACLVKYLAVTLPCDTQHVAFVLYQYFYFNIPALRQPVMELVWGIFLKGKKAFQKVVSAIFFGDCHHWYIPLTKPKYSPDLAPSRFPAVPKLEYICFCEVHCVQWRSWEGCKLSLPGRNFWWETLDQVCWSQRRLCWKIN